MRSSLRSSCLMLCLAISATATASQPAFPPALDAIDPSVPGGAVQIRIRTQIMPPGPSNLCAEALSSGLILQPCITGKKTQLFEFQALRNPATGAPLLHSTIFQTYLIKSMGAGLCLASPHVPPGFKPEDGLKLGAIRFLACDASDPEQRFAYHPQGEILSIRPKGYCVGSQEDWMAAGRVLTLWVCRDSSNGTQSQILDPVAYP